MISKKLITAALLATSAIAHAAPMPTVLTCFYMTSDRPALVKPAESALQAARGSNTPAEAEAIYALVDVKSFQANPAERSALIKQANAIWAAQQPDIQLVTSMYEHAWKLEQANNCGLASPLLRTTLSLAERLSPPDEPLVYKVLTELVRIAAASRNKADLMQHAPRLLAYWEQHGQPADAIASPVYSRLVDLYYKDAQYALAEPLALRNLKSGEQSYGQDHAALVPRLYDLASVYYAQLRYDEGEAAMARVTGIQSKGAVTVQRPPNPQQISETAMRQLYAQGDVAGALARGERDISQLEQAVASDTQALQAASKAREDQSQGNAKAGPLLEAERKARSKLSVDAKALTAARVRVAEILHAQKRYEQAQALYLQALEDLARPGADVLDGASVKSDLAMLYRARGNDAAALPLQSEALELMLPIYGPLHPDVIDSARELAALYKRQGKAAELAALTARVPALGKR